MRRSLGKSVRFDVLNRDRFTCQYCGRSAPEVVLEVDHVTPVVLGGTNDMWNLATACKDCNAGKSKKVLSDEDSDTRNLEDIQVNCLVLLDESLSRVGGMKRMHLSFRECIREFGFFAICRAMERVYEEVLDFEEGCASPQSWSVAFDAMIDICDGRTDWVHRANQALESRTWLQ